MMAKYKLEKFLKSAENYFIVIHVDSMLHKKYISHKWIKQYMIFKYLIK